MEKSSIAIATISWARNEEEEEQLKRSLAVLSGLGLPVFVTDGGSSESFRNELERLPHLHLHQVKGLWPQAKASIRAAKESGASTILYTEPDKEVFFARHLSSMIECCHWHENTGVVLASRSAKGFASFPPFQQMTETAINDCCREVIGKDVDYCYGPFLFSSRLVASLDTLPDDCGWGWRPFLFATAHRRGFTVDAYEEDFYCPPDQQQDDAKERIYRMKQLTQNIEGLVLACSGG